MAVTSVTYEGDGSQTNFSVPFPFISRDHVEVYVNAIEVLQPSIWYWISDSTIAFRNAPNSGDSIQIKRVTPGDTRLVNFQNGAVLTEADLDLSANQIFYLAQETKENLTALINDELIRVGTSQGIAETDPDIIIAGLVEKMLESASADTLQQAIGDIDDQGEVILDIQTKLDGSIEVIDFIGAMNGTETAFILDTSVVKVDSDAGESLAEKFTVLSGLEVRYGVTLDANGYITGFAQHNDGETGSFVVLADKFAIVDPNTLDQVVLWDGVDELLSIAGNVQVNTGGAFVSGQTSYDTGTGFWLGVDGGTPKFSIGNSADEKLTWDGSTLSLVGNLSMTNAYTEWTPTWSGFSDDPGGKFRYIDFGAWVLLWFHGDNIGTSDDTTMAVTGMPSAIIPSSNRLIPCMVYKAGEVSGFCRIVVTGGGSSGSLSFEVATVSGSEIVPDDTGFASSGFKGLGAGFMITYAK